MTGRGGGDPLGGDYWLGKILLRLAILLPVVDEFVIAEMLNSKFKGQPKNAIQKFEISVPLDQRASK
jgi:hypothetical protein